MLCYLDSVEVRPREGKLPFFVCTWNGISGDNNAAQIVERNGKRFVNLQAAKERNVILTKSIFPASEEKLAMWAQNLICRRVVIPKKDSNGKFTDELDEVINEENAQKTWLNLVYIQVPLTAISDDIKLIEFTDKSGNVHRQSYITVIGFADELDKWSEDLTPEEMAKNNLTANLNNGTYLDVSDLAKPEVTSINSVSASQAQQAPQQSNNPLNSLL